MDNVREQSRTEPCVREEREGSGVHTMLWMPREMPRLVGME